MHKHGSLNRYFYECFSLQISSLVGFSHAYVCVIFTSPLLYDLLLKHALEFFFNREDEIDDIQKVFSRVSINYC